MQGTRSAGILGRLCHTIKAGWLSGKIGTKWHIIESLDTCTLWMGKGQHKMHGTTVRKKSLYDRPIDRRQRLTTPPSKPASEDRPVTHPPKETTKSLDRYQNFSECKHVVRRQNIGTRYFAGVFVLIIFVEFMM